MGDSHGPLFPPYMDLQTLKSETDFSPLLQWKQLKLELLDNAVIQKKKVMQVVVYFIVRVPGEGSF